MARSHVCIDTGAYLAGEDGGFGLTLVNAGNGEMHFATDIDGAVVIHRPERCLRATTTVTGIPL